MACVNGIAQFLPATHMTILTLLRKHSPDGTTRRRRYTSDIAYYSIYQPWKDERLSWPSWLTYSGRHYSHKWSPVRCRSSVGQKSSPVKDQRSNHCAMQPTGKVTAGKLYHSRQYLQCIQSCATWQN